MLIALAITGVLLAVLGEALATLADTPTIHAKRLLAVCNVLVIGGWVLTIASAVAIMFGGLT